MNKIKTMKYKTNSDVASTSNNNNNNNNGIFTKISKRYSTFSSKIIKRQSPGRRGTSPQKVISGSYNMTGLHSDDHRLEIGAPILISTTTIDSDRFDRKYQPITVASNTTSSGSDEYTDAVSSLQNLQDIKFEFISRSSEGGNNVSTEMNNTTTSAMSAASVVVSSSDSNENIYETPKSSKSPLTNDQMKGVQNLHKSELRVFLQKAPLHEFDLNETSNDIENTTTNNLSLDAQIAPYSMEIYDNPIVQVISKSEPNSPMCPEKQMLINQHHYMSADSINIDANKRKSVIFSSNISMNEGGGVSRSNTNLDLNSSLEDFDLKSVSCQSLNAQNLFLSIDELNEITRQINDSEDFTQDIDLEYCTHRDNLKPHERRITLMKNKNSRLMNKEKINHAWSGIKHWIGEESVKIKEVMQKQAALQRVGTKNNENLSKNESRSSMGNGRESVEKSIVDLTNVPSMLSVNKSSIGHYASTIVGGDGINDDLESVLSANREVSPFNNKKVREKWEGQNGFEELRRYIKSGGDFGKELITILQERVESEQNYAKSLSKMANKLNKACRELPGSIADAWRGVATEMESRSDVHRQFSSSLIEELVKPLKSLVDHHHKTRKNVENNVDKSSRVLTEWRISESKAKKMSHSAARENEKLQDALLDVRIQKAPSIALLQQSTNKNIADKELKLAEKDCAKLDNKRRKAEETVKRADVEYYTLCVRAERARVDWEMSVLRGSTLLQSLENQRLANMKNFVSSYMRLTTNFNPIIDGIIQRLQPQIDFCNVQKDLSVVKNLRRISEGPSEQLLPDFYCEHTTLAMNRERRKHALIKLLQLVKSDLERERRSRNGLKGLTQSLNNQENQAITDKLYHIRSMLTYLEGARFKLHSALLELDHKPRTSHPLASHIQITRDRTGLQQSILKVPLWLKNNDRVNNDDSKDLDEYETESQVNGSCVDIKNDALIKKLDTSFSRCQSNLEIIPNSEKINLNVKSNTMITKRIDSPSFDRGIADGGSNQPDSDFDEFSSQDDEDEDSQSKKDNKIDEIDCNTVNANKDNSSDELLVNNRNKPIVISKCKALYSYTPKLYDELELNPGDIIEVHTKQEDGWWLGQLKNHIGIFPATYVEELI